MNRSILARCLFGLGLAAFTLEAAPAAAQNKYILKANHFLGSAGEGDTVLATALNLCDVPIHVTIDLVDGATGAELATAFEGDVAAGRTASLDVLLGPVSGARAHRVVATVQAELPTGVTTIPDCMKGKAAAVAAQLEIVKPGGTSLLLPAVQKVRDAAAR